MGGFIIRLKRNLIFICLIFLIFGSISTIYANNVNNLTENNGDSLLTDNENMKLGGGRFSRFL